MRILVISPGQQYDVKGHERLSCDSCHASWAPQCYGCHIEYDTQETQWDHLKQKITFRRWNEKRWAVESGIPALGVTSKKSYHTFYTYNESDFADFSGISKCAESEFCSFVTKYI